MSMNLPEIGGKPQNKTSSIGDGGGIKMKSNLSRESSSTSKPTSPPEKTEEEKKLLFSPNN